jgi:hypothetical protein
VHLWVQGSHKWKQHSIQSAYCNVTRICLQGSSENRTLHLHRSRKPRFYVVERLFVHVPSNPSINLLVYHRSQPTPQLTVGNLHLLPPCSAVFCGFHPLRLLQSHVPNWSSVQMTLGRNYNYFFDDRYQGKSELAMPPLFSLLIISSWVSWPLGAPHSKPPVRCSARFRAASRCIAWTCAAG